MQSFRFATSPLDTAAERARILDPACGGYASFEGWVRDHNEGQQVRHLQYEAFEALANKEGERIIAEAVARFGVEHAACVHRVGDLQLGEIAVWVGASARHRQEAFLACRYIIDEVKHRAPIWKKEHYVGGDSGWVNCERCAAVAPDSAPKHAHDHDHDHEPQHSHSQAQPPARATADYSRQQALKEVGESGQARLRAARVLVVGAGGLGVPVLAYLAGAGVGRLGIIDGDVLEASNLHRQPLYSFESVGQPKAQLAAARLRALNPDIEVQVYGVRLTALNAAELIGPWDLVIDCTDNFSTKFLINDACVTARKPAILSSIYQYEGQLQVIRPDAHGACLRCIWPQATRDGLVGNCAEAGVLGPVPGVFGSLQALEALKILLGLPGQLGDELLVMDLLTLQVSRMKTRRAGVCAAGPCVRIPATPAAHAALERHFDSLAEAQAAGYTVIDIREPAEVAEEPLSGSAIRRLPMQQLLRPDAGLGAAERYLLVCASGRRSLAAAQTLHDRGFQDVCSLTGGVAGLLAQQSA
ncbi:MAG TPA: ThiF family adenylyltransferase [Steroidobacteraceae bacterium]|nr:ThiF family adenylyltransferase [Steroidobacteraceae bacterium]